jgi:hypothetical protein
MKRNIMQNPAFQQMIGRMNDSDGVFLCLTTLHRGPTPGSGGTLNHEIMTDDFLLGDIMKSVGSHERLAIEHLKGDNVSGMIPVAQGDSKGTMAPNTAPEPIPAPRVEVGLRPLVEPTVGPGQVISSAEVKAEPEGDGGTVSPRQEDGIQKFSKVMSDIATKDNGDQNDGIEQQTDSVQSDEVSGAECGGVQPDADATGPQSG